MPLVLRCILNFKDVKLQKFCFLWKISPKLRILVIYECSWSPLWSQRMLQKWWLSWYKIDSESEAHGEQGLGTACGKWSPPLKKISAVLYDLLRGAVLVAHESSPSCLNISRTKALETKLSFTLRVWRCEMYSLGSTYAKLG